MKKTTRQLTVAAVCTALAIIMCAMTAYLPLSFMPLYLAAFCIFAACKKSGVGYGLLCAAATVAIMFLMSGLSVKWLMLIIMFAPYGILTYFTDRFTYFKIKSAVIRLLIAIVFFNVTFGAVYAITVNVITVGLSGMNVSEWAGHVGGYAVLAVIATAVLVPLDFIFSAISKPILKRIPSGAEKPRGSQGGVSHEKEHGVDDVFGYEVYDTVKEKTIEDKDASNKVNGDISDDGNG